MKKMISLVTALLFAVLGFANQVADDNNGVCTGQETPSQANQVLVLLAHPDISQSKANSALLAAVQGLPGVQVINIYKEPFQASTYTEAFRKSEVIVFQFPFYWASAPHLLKKWCDEIFGSVQNNPGVQGKKLMVATTTGSEYEAYRSGGRNQFTMDELLRPYQMLANHSGMVWATPFVVYGASLPDAATHIEVGAKAYKEQILKLQTSK